MTNLAWQHVDRVPFEDSPVRKLHVKATAGGMAGQFSDGYILGIIGIALSLAASEMNLSTYWLGIIGAASLFGILFGSLISGQVADKIGRKPIYYTTMVVFCVASVLQFFVADPTQLLVLRLILGVAIGADYAASLALVSEVVPQQRRGKMLSLLMVAWVCGFVTAYAIGFCFSDLGPDAWRWALASSAIPAAIALMIRIGTPESPLWLVSKGRQEEAISIIRAHLGDAVDLPRERLVVQKSKWSKLFGRQYWKSTFVGSVFFTCQVIPYFALSTFIPKVLESLKVENVYASGIIYNAFLVAGVFGGLWLINKVSRRAFLLGSFYIGAVMLGTLAAWAEVPTVISIALLAVLAIAMASSSVLEFAYTPELFPTELRASGVGVVVAVSRVGAGSATFLLPVILESYGAHAALAACGVVMLLGGVVCHLFAPETGNGPLNAH